MKNKLVLILCLIANTLFAQYQNTVWCFGDSAGIDFNSGSAMPSNSIVNWSPGSSASICDSAGNLLFYAFNQPIALQAVTVVNAANQVMLNGDSVFGDGFYQDLLIIPKPASNGLFYLVSILFVSAPYDGLLYSVIDINQQGGLGAVTQKNQLKSYFSPIDCITAIRHGNGRDWWMITKLATSTTGNNQYYRYLVSPSGISNPVIQSIGPLLTGNLSRLKFSPLGDKLMLATGQGTLEMFDFDRCTGLLSNYVHIDQNIMAPMASSLSGAEFSPNGRFFYVSNTDNGVMVNPPLDTTSMHPFKCYQYDLQAANITASKTLVYTDSIAVSRGLMQLAPDGKIYIGTIYGSFPYTATQHNFYNHRLCFIENPNMQGTACGFNPFGFYLGSGRSYWGLPNQLDYQLGALTGSPCDTITAINNLQATENNATLNATYIPTWDKLFVNAQNLKGKNVQLTMYDAAGKQVYTTARRLSPLRAGGSTGGYFTHEVNCSAFFNGMYILNLQTEKEVLVKRFVKE